MPYTQIQVSDTGNGISPDFLPYLFERFCQADSTDTRSNKGLGLGLAIASHVVELHGGTKYFFHVTDLRSLPKTKTTVP